MLARLAKAAYLFAVALMIVAYAASAATSPPQPQQPVQPDQVEMWYC